MQIATKPQILPLTTL